MQLVVSSSLSGAQESVKQIYKEIPVYLCAKMCEHVANRTISVHALELRSTKAQFREMLRVFQDPDIGHFRCILVLLQSSENAKMGGRGRGIFRF